MVGSGGRKAVSATGELRPPCSRCASTALCLVKLMLSCSAIAPSQALVASVARTLSLGMLNIALDWSDHALWWPEKNSWLTHTRSTLDQSGVTASAQLEFTPMHKVLRVQMPDLREMDFKVDFSVKTFNAIVDLCKQMGIRHPEEMSFCKPITADDLKYNYAERQLKKLQQAKVVNGQLPADTNTFVANKSTSNMNRSYNTSNGSLDRSAHSPGTPSGTWRHPNSSMNGSLGVSFDGAAVHVDSFNGSEQLNSSLSNSLLSPPDGARAKLPRPKTLLEKARMNLPADTNTFVANKSTSNMNRSYNTSNGSLDRSAHSPGTPSGTWRHPNSSMNGSLGVSFDGAAVHVDSFNGSEQLNSSLSNSLLSPPDGARAKLPRPKTLLEKARMNVGWLDSSLSIMEQGVKEGHTLLLRFKFYSFYDLNPKYDAARINLIFNQAKYQILNEEVDCTEEEMLMFAALQLQVKLQAIQPQSQQQNSVDDDIDRALNDLQVSLEGGNHLTPNIPSNSDIMHVPELKGTLKCMKPRRFTLKSFKDYFFVCRDLRLTYYRNIEETEPIEVVELQGCEVTPDVHISSNKYGIKLEVPSAQQQQGMTEYILRLSDEDQYARWMAALRLAAKGKTLADSSYQSEVRGIQAFLSLQQPRAPALSPEQHGADINPEEYLSPRFSKKIRGGKSGWCTGKPADPLSVTRILEAHANVKELGLIEAKMQFIRAWQALPDYGLSFFLVKHMGHKKEELLAVAFNRIMKMDLNSGDHIKTIRYNSIKAWNVNWGTKHMMIQTEQENLTFSCLTAECKVVHEFIGGYIFLSMRTKDANQTLDDELFHKLTGGWA
ncbi:FERM central domain [Trinorchestia longiramus]|nr:FERM central domain [Trinorchestia longiramus]